MLDDSASSVLNDTPHEPEEHFYDTEVQEVQQQPAPGKVKRDFDYSKFDNLVVSDEEKNGGHKVDPASSMLNNTPQEPEEPYYDAEEFQEVREQPAPRKAKRDFDYSK